MDAMVGLLDGTRARGAFLLRGVLDPPWALRIQDRAPLTLVAVVRGHAWLTMGQAAPVPAGAGDVALIRGPDHYEIADTPNTPAQVVIHPGQRCTTLHGEDLALSMGLGIRTWGNNPDGATMMLTGTYESHSTIAKPLLDALPPIIVVRGNDWDSPLVELLGQEIVKNDPGQDVVLDRLLDLLVVAVVRAWCTRQDSAAPGWWRASNDPIVGHALRLIHNRPDEPWTIATLAHEVGVSRANLARRFHDLVGVPPIGYLTRWRLALAADLLANPDATIAAVAQQVGYSSAFALSTAYKRHHGLSPRQHRTSQPRPPKAQPHADPFGGGAPAVGVDADLPPRP
ncbi:MAG: AraC family transcriptional regulator [Acidimicrobiales bacterium]